MKQNRKLILVLALVLSLALVSGSTLAYLTDTDKDVNVMTLGNVKIDQIELQRPEQSDANTDPENVEDFTDFKPLYPAVGPIEWADEYQEWPTGGSNQLFTDKLQNVVDKFVFVENTGKSPAYVRTWFAFEQGSLSNAELDKLLHTNINGTHWTWVTVAEGVEIKTADNNTGKYTVMVATYTGTETVHPGGILPAGETTRPSLLQVFLDPTATNEDVEDIDGNGNGTYDILVVSQAVQTAGFKTADEALTAGFGAAKIENHPFGEVNFGEEAKAPVTVSTLEEMMAALKAGETIIGAENIDFIFKPAYWTESWTDGKPYTLDAKGAKVTLDGVNSNENGNGYAYLGFAPGSAEEMALSNLSVTGSGFVEFGHHPGKIADIIRGTFDVENLTIRNLNATLTVNNGGNNIGAAFTHYGTATLTNCTMTGTTTYDGFAPYDAAFVNGTKTTIVGGTYEKLYLANQAHVTITGAEIETIDSYAISKNGLGKLVIGEGAHVGTINLYDTGKYLATLTIEEGATVDKIIYNGTEYTQAEWLAR